MKRFIITEEEKKHIMGLYEQSLNPTYNNPLCNNMTGTFGTGSETNFKSCVYKLPGSFAIDLRDSTGKILFSDGGSTFEDAVKTYYSKATQFYPDKKVGIDLPVPVDPDNESTAKYYKLGK